MARIALDTLGDDDRRRIDYLTAMRRLWSTEVFGRLRDEFDTLAAREGAPTTLEEAGELVERCPSYAWFGFLERGAQVLKWRVVNDVVARNWETLGEDLRPPHLARAELDPELELPGWYRDHDIHCQPGGVWGAAPSALVYEIGTQVLHIGRNRGLELHRRFTATFPGETYRRIVVMGSGFGKSTRPFKERYAEADVIGIEFSGPCVRLAATRADDDGLEITFRQGDAAATGLPDGTVDVVTGTMVLHEMPPDVLRATFAEAARILTPGGIVRFLEFSRTGDLFRDAVMEDHAWRQNEPFMPGLMEFDVVRELSAVGLAGARWVPFDERTGALLPEGFPERAEWHLPWAVLEAHKPALAASTTPPAPAEGAA